MKRKSGCGSGCLGIVLLLAVVVGMGLLADRIDERRFPWGYPSPGRSTLAGTWVGPVTTASGQRLGMLVDIELAPLGRGRRRKQQLFRTRRSRWLEGRALVCSPSGGVQRFTMSGKPDDTKAASRFHLSLSAADSVARDGLTPSHIQGQWSGGDALGLSVSLYMRRGKSAITSSSDPDTGGDTPATLKRGTEAEFNSLCRR